MHPSSSAKPSGSARNASRSQDGSHLPLVLFTLCAGMSVGVVLAALIDAVYEMVTFRSFLPLLPRIPPIRLMHTLIILQTDAIQLALACIALALTSVGMVASIAHLAKPLCAPRALTNLASSWLSREILIVAAYWASIALWTALQFVSDECALLSCAVALALGCVLLIVAARAYAIPSQPAWNGRDTALELFAVACGTGLPLASLVVLWMRGIAPHMLTLFLTGIIAAALIFDYAQRYRTGRLLAALQDNPTPRTYLAADRILDLAELQIRIERLIYAGMSIASVSMLLHLIHALTKIPTAEVSFALAVLSVIVEYVAFFLARTRFYHMPVMNRHAVRRDFR